MLVYEIYTFKTASNGLEYNKQTLQSIVPLLPIIFKKAEEKIKLESKENFYIRVFKKTKKGDKLIYDGSKTKQKKKSE